jgi:hypothetical protein
MASTSHASLTLTSGLGTTHANNLVTNGSFEIGAPPNNAPNNVYWATGTSSTPFSSPPGWTTSGAAANQGRWGNDAGSPYRLASSDLLPDGRAAIFFNNGTGFVNQAPTMLGNGAVTFASTPMFTSTDGAPAIISQTVPTNLFVQPSYDLSFWVSGEENSTNQGNTGLSIMGFRITNVLPGDPIQYLTVPNSIFLGQSHLYEYTFTPINPSLPVTISFATWGHMDLTAWGGTPFGTEAILDDVIINAVPEPASVVLFGLGGVALWSIGRRKKREQGEVEHLKSERGDS